MKYLVTPKYLVARKEARQGRRKEGRKGRSKEGQEGTHRDRHNARAEKRKRRGEKENLTKIPGGEGAFIRLYIHV